MPDPTGLWIATQPATDGTYVAALEIGQDLSVPLTREYAVRYALAVIDAALRAEYDAAILAQFGTGMGLDNEHIVLTLTGVRDLRPAQDHDATAPLRFTPGVNADGDAFLAIHLDGRQIGQFDPADAIVHAAYVLQGPIAAGLDAAYHRWLRQGLDTTDTMARAMVGDLEKWRPDTGRYGNGTPLEDGQG